MKSEGKSGQIRNVYVLCIASNFNNYVSYSLFFTNSEQCTGAF